MPKKIKKPSPPSLSSLSTEELLAELARRRAAEPRPNMTSMELSAEADAAALKQATMAARLERLSGEEGNEPKRCPRCGTRCRVKANKRERTLVTLSGTATYRRNYHYCEGCGSGWYPLDVELGIPESSLPWATSFVDGAAPIATTAPTNGDILGAVTAAADWTFPWAYGIHEDNRGQALWFE